MNPIRSLRRLLAGLTATQLTAGTAVLAAIALTGSLILTGRAVRMDQREEAAITALADFAAMVSKLGSETDLTAGALTPTDAAYLSAWMTVFQEGAGDNGRTLAETCRTGRGGAGVRLIRVPDAKPAGLAALATAPSTPMPRFGSGVSVVRLARGTACETRAVEAVVVTRRVGSLDISAGRIVDRSGQAWGRAVLAVSALGLLILITGVTAATFARRRLTRALAALSYSLDRAAVGDFSHRAPEVGVAAELTELTGRVNHTLDRLQELLSWLRDSSDQLAHDFRTPLARAAARLGQLSQTDDEDERSRLTAAAHGDIKALTRAMNEAMSLRDGESWVFETVRLDELAAQAADLYGPVGEAAGVDIVVEAEPVEILGVRSLLQRAVANLVDNAVKFSPESGTVRLTVRRDHGRATLAVADQGPGIDPGVLDDPEAMRRSRRAHNRESHGMGLSFVRAIIRRHGGEMTIDDARPGAVVTLRFSG